MQQEFASTGRVAVLGLYNSGSTVLAGMLHRLGVDMGGPFWTNSIEGDPKNFYEPMDLSCRLREWWGEPLAVERAPAAERVAGLRDWAEKRQAGRRGWVGAKHPLLSLCAADLVEAWGKDVVIVRAFRSFEASFDGLRRRGWFMGHELSLQYRLWDALERFETTRPPNVTLNWEDVKAEPGAAATALAEGVGLKVTDEQLRAAGEVVRRPVREAGATREGH